MEASLGSYLNRHTGRYTRGQEPVDYEEKYVFVKEISAEFKCMICSKLLRDPQVTECCGQHFCQYCMDKWLTTNCEKLCPYCRIKNCNYIRYLPMKREIIELEIYCQNREKGCESTSTIQQINEHIKQCDFEQVRCVCASSFLRKELENHRQNHCPDRQVKCQYCQVCGAYRFINSGIHENECPDFPMNCPKQCGASGIKRKNLDNHRKKCSLEIVECQYSKAGCKERLQRRNSEAHLKENIEKHLQLTMASFTRLSTQHETLKKAHLTLKKERNALKKKNTRLQQNRLVLHCM